jgi:Nod factor-specific ABC transporter NodJ protein
VTECAVVAEEITRQHGSRVAIDRLDLRIPYGIRLGIVGPNGAGKTTLMRMISSALTPTAGRLTVLGHDTSRDSRAAKAGIGVVPQGMTLDTELRVGENLTVFARYLGLAGEHARRRVEESLAAVELSDVERLAVHELSGGMQRRLLIARALIGEPRLVLLDEPTTGLDPESRTVVWEHLLEHSARGATLIVASHHLDEVEELCDELLFLDAGHAKNIVRVAELRSRLPPIVVEHPCGLEPRPRADAVIPGIVAHRGSRELIYCHDPAPILSLLDAEVDGRSPSARQSTVEDAVWLSWQAHRGLADTTMVRPDPSCRVILGCSSDASPNGERRRRTGWPCLVQVRRVWLRNFTLFKRSYRTTIVPNFFEPVFLLLALGLGLSPFVQLHQGGESFIRFIAPGLLAVSTMNGAVFEVTYNIFVRLRHARSYEAVVTTPVEPQDIALGELAWSLTRCLVYSSVFVIVLIAIGLARAPAALLAPVLLLPLGLVFACIGMLFTSIATVINSYSYFYALFITPLTLVSGVFFPTATTGALAVVQQANPLHHGVEVARALLGDGGVAAALSSEAWLLAAGLLLLPFSIASLRRHLVGLPGRFRRFQAVGGRR